MGRKPKQRVNFYQDTQFLLRMGKAIAADNRLPPDWRQSVQGKINSLVSDLMQGNEHLDNV